MRISKAIFAVIAGATMTSAALAQDNAAVSAETTTGIKTLVPTLYGNVQVRHYTFREMEDDKVANIKPLVEVRPAIGATFFNDKLDQMFMWDFAKNAGDATITKSWLVSVTQYKLLSSDLGYVGPYAETYQDNGFGFNESLVGLYGEFAKDAPVTIGAVTLSGWAQWNAILNSPSAASEDANRVQIENRTGRDSFASNEGDAKINKRDPSYIALTALGAKLKPAAVPGFSVGTELEYDLQWDPKYAAVDDGAGADEIDQVGYATKRMMISKFILGYKVSDAVSLTNSLRLKTVGFYEEGLDVSDGALSKNRWENRLVMSATLF